MAGFSITDILNQASQAQTSDSQHSQGEITISYIPIDKIKPSKRNFYEMSAMEALASAIDLQGLRKPIELLSPDADGIHTILDGERRYRACKTLHDEDASRFAKLPCIIKPEIKPGSDEEQLQRIFANATARDINPYERAEQVEQLTEIIAAMRADGHPMEGKTRTAIAKALGVSESQIGIEIQVARMEPQAKDILRTNDVGISAAHEVAKLPEAEQVKAATAVVEKKEFKPPRTKRHKLDAVMPSEKETASMVKAIRDDMNAGRMPPQHRILAAVEAAYYWMEGRKT